MKESSFMNRLLLVVIISVIIAIIAVYSISVLQKSSDTLRGTILTPPRNAPDFSLYDSNGNMIELSKFYGKVIILTFLYANCPDYCPAAADRIAQVARDLDSQGYANKYAIIIVSVDPERDIRDANKFLEKHGLSNKAYYLVGPNSTLKSVYTSYGIFVEKQGSGENYTVAHTAVIYLIDKQLRLRVAYSGLVGWGSNDLLHDVILLIKE